MGGAITRQQDRPIFVLGCPRSGTTMLQLMLHAHPRIAMPPETRFVERVYFGRRSFGDLRDADNRRRLGRAIVEPPESRFRDLRLDRAEVVERIVASAPTVGSACETVFRMYADSFGKSRWGDKRPGYHRVVPVLRRMFPDALFVHLVRDGRDCVASLKRAPWWKLSTYESVQSWMLATGNAMRAARTLPPDSFYELHYEQLVAEPEVQLAALCEFLGEDYDDAMARPKDQAGVAVPVRKMRVEGTYRDVSTSSVGRWRGVLEPWEIELCDAVMGRRLRGYGYALTGEGRPWGKHGARYLEAVAGRRVRWYRKVALDRLDLVRHRQPVAAVSARPGAAADHGDRAERDHRDARGEVDQLGL